MHEVYAVHQHARVFVSIHLWVVLPGVADTHGRLVSRQRLIVISRGTQHRHQYVFIAESTVTLAVIEVGR